MRGLAEVPRLILAAADAKYTDERMTFTMHADGKDADVQGWPERKTKVPYGQVPTLTVDGTEIAQSAAIIRYLAKKYHLDGDNELDCAVLDAGQ